MWVFLEGLDRTGKSSVGAMFKSLGFDVVHMSAPNKKYLQEGYVGPSYFEEIIELYTRYSGKNVLFDRTVYGEKIWPQIYGRQSQLDIDDFDYLKEMEEQNETTYILMFDENTDAHWQRCVANKEPLTKHQFLAARALFDILERQNGFRKFQLGDFSAGIPFDVGTVVPKGTKSPVSNSSDDILSTAPERSELIKKTQNDRDLGASRGASDIPISPSDNRSSSKGTSRSLEQLKLDKANAINSVLSNRIVKRKGEEFDIIEDGIRNFLNSELSKLFGDDKELPEFDEQDRLILKRYCEQIKTKIGGTK